MQLTNLLYAVMMFLTQLSLSFLNLLRGIWTRHCHFFSPYPCPSCCSLKRTICLQTTVWIWCPPYSKPVPMPRFLIALCLSIVSGPSISHSAWLLKWCKRRRVAEPRCSESPDCPALGGLVSMTIKNPATHGEAALGAVRSR